MEPAVLISKSEKQYRATYYKHKDPDLCARCGSTLTRNQIRAAQINCAECIERLNLEGSRIEKAISVQNLRTRVSIRSGKTVNEILSLDYQYKKV